jgi:hypothetical protein
MILRLRVKTNKATAGLIKTSQEMPILGSMLIYMDSVIDQAGRTTTVTPLATVCIGSGTSHWLSCVTYERSAEGSQFDKLCRRDGIIHFGLPWVAPVHERWF